MFTCNRAMASISTVSASFHRQMSAPQPQPITRSITLLFGENGQPSAELLSKTQFHTNPSISREILQNPDSVLLHYSKPSIEIIRNLSSKYPRVLEANIIINECDTSVNELIGQLLKGWSPEIVSLNIWALYLNHEGNKWDPNEFDCRNYEILFESINQLSALKQFTFECFNMIFKIDLKILSQIETFYFYSYDDADLLHYSLTEYASSNTKLLDWKIANSIGWMSSLENYFKLSQDFTDRCSHLNLGPIAGIDEIRLQKFSSKFANLTSVQLNLGYLTLQIVSQCLSLLKSLDHLVLDVNTSSNIKQRKPLETSQGLRISYVDIFPTCTSKSINRLSVRVWNCIALHNELENQLKSETLNLVLPNVEVLHYYNDSSACRECDYVGYGFGIQERMECTRKFLLPLRKFKNLKRIVVEYEAIGESEGRMMDIDNLW